MNRPIQDISVEDEVLGNLRRAPLGPPSAPVGTVADLNLPLDFMRRLADRVIQASFRERHRIVVGGPSTVEHRPPPLPPAAAAPDWVTIIPERRARQDGPWIEHRPGRGEFRAPILAGKAEGEERAFRAIADSGNHPLRTFRLQLTGPGYYAGPGDGGSLDILKQLLDASPGASFFVSVENRHLSGIVSHLATWRPVGSTRLTLIPESLPLSQWAQDNAKPGHFGGPASTPVLLSPRWAGRGEDGGFFIPGESFLIDGLAAAGLHCSQSGLLFEGGNAIIVEEPGGRRVLLLGEAEIHRNVARGLAREEAEKALLREFQADACCILPAASFHIDLEVTARSHEGRVLAFVPDSLGAVRTICRLAAERLHGRGMMSASDAAACSQAAAAGQLPVLLARLGNVIGPRAVGPGHFPLDLAMVFKDGPTDSGVGNLHRVLLALDWITAEVTPPNRYPADRHAASYLHSLRRNEADRRTIHRQLKQLGWEVIPIPAISSESLSLNPINSLHEPGRTYMSAYGGFFSPLDDQAVEAFRARLGPGVEIVKIATGETQRRAGGLHCAVQAW